MGNIENTVMASGKVNPIQSVDVGLRYQGELSSCMWMWAMKSKKGDLIAQINQVQQKTPSPMSR
ncbi:hypothetical protein ACSF86_03200 [Moraxella bovoculi]|uniref:hypothetical protein n=1 Tax=Moraxella bovoculi TaxID=386891 RepID=UPI003F4F85BC